MATFRRILEELQAMQSPTDVPSTRRHFARLEKKIARLGAQHYGCNTTFEDIDAKEIARFLFNVAGG